MYFKYNFYIVIFDDNKTGISGLPFNIVCDIENDELIFQMLRDIEFSFIKSNGDNIKMKIFAIEKSRNSFIMLNDYLEGKVIDKKVIELFSIDTKISIKNVLEWECILYEDKPIIFNVFAYEGKYFICNPMFTISQSKLNSLM